MPTSPLLRLPPELRNKIYAYIFSGYQIDIWFADKFEASLTGENSWRSTPDIFQALVAPTYTCRQIYAETRLLPYKYSMYVFTYGHWFIKWLDGLEDAVQAIVWDRVGDLAKEAVFAQG